MRDILYPVLDAIGPNESIGKRQPREEKFLSPGTWTRPPTTNWVQVLLVGGGGGAMGSAPFPNGSLGGNGGGGGVRLELVPVSSPVPITVGAGGTAGAVGPTTPTTTVATAGGSSAFGPLAPPVPPSTIQVGGGGAGLAYAPGVTDPLWPTMNSNAPSDGGGGGSGNPGAVSGPAAAYVNGRGGKYGTGAGTLTSGGAGRGGGPTYDGAQVVWYSDPPNGSVMGNTNYGLYGYGGGAGCSRDGGGPYSGGAGASNTGGGAQSYTSTGYAGGSGIVIVRWWE